jgi:hypothetical protein
MIVFKVEKTMRGEIEKAWRDRLAHNLKTFRRIRGRWPYKECVPAVKRSIADAVRLGVRPPYQH